METVIIEKTIRTRAGLYALVGLLIGFLLSKFLLGKKKRHNGGGYDTEFVDESDTDRAVLPISKLYKSRLTLVMCFGFAVLGALAGLQQETTHLKARVVNNGYSNNNSLTNENSPARQWIKNLMPGVTPVPQQQQQQTPPPPARGGPTNGPFIRQPSPPSQTSDLQDFF